MKKLLLLLFSVIISFNSYGEWTKLVSMDNSSVFIDLETLKEKDGYVYWWLMDSTNNSSTQADAFRDSIERAVYKASPLPSAPDDAVFDREILLEFRIN